MSSPRTLLVISYYGESFRSLFPVLAAITAARDVRPIMLVTSTGRTAADTEALIRSSGYEVARGVPCEADLGHRTMHNPWRRARLLNDANVALTGRILDQIAPEGILCTQDVARGRFLRVAADRAVPSLYVQWTEVHSPEFHRRFRAAEIRHADAGLPPYRFIRRKLVRGLESLVEPPRWWPLHTPATCLAVQGEFTRRMCLEAGVPEHRLVVTGSPQCDEMYRAARRSAADLGELRRSLGLQGDGQFVLYPHEHTGRLSHLRPESAARADQWLLDGVRLGAPDLPRVVKLHPRDDAEARLRLQAADPGAILVPSDVPIGDLIAASSLVVSMTSSTLLWAIGIDRPAISAYFWEGVDEFRMTRHWPGVELVDTPEALTLAVRRNLHDADHMATWRTRRAACREDFLCVDGRSVERIADLYCSLAGGKPGPLGHPGAGSRGTQRRPDPQRLASSTVSDIGGTE